MAHKLLPPLGKCARAHAEAKLCVVNAVAVNNIEDEVMTRHRVGAWMPVVTKMDGVRGRDLVLCGRVSVA